MKEEHRPWGRFIVLHEGPGFKVKILEVEPGSRLSYQSHERRSERWTVVSGTATVVRDDETTVHEKGGVVIVGTGMKHRLANNGEGILRIVEVQLGDYLEEDDIMRYEDDFGRGPKG